MHSTEVVITGLGFVTPLGTSAKEVLRRMRAGESAAMPMAFGDYVDPACPRCARIGAFDAEALVPEPKTIRLMSRDALLAAAAARLALQDARMSVGVDYAPDQVGLFGATGLAGVPLSEVSRLIDGSSDDRGRLDLHRFGEAALKQVRPVLSFKILSNMPLCFISIFENIQGPNAVFNPWEGQGAHAIAAAIDCIRDGDAPCAIAGGTDVKTHELALIALKQQGVLRACPATVPAEGAVFLVLEDGRCAESRGARIYARIREYHLATVTGDRVSTYRSILRPLERQKVAAIVAAGDAAESGESQALEALDIDCDCLLRPKAHVGNLFAAAAALQVGTAAAISHERKSGVTLANCFGHGSEQAAFVLEAP